MEGSVGSRFGTVGSMARKKRSNTSRRPRPNPFTDGRDTSSLPLTPPTGNLSKGSSAEKIGHDADSQKKEFNLNQCASNISSIRVEAASRSTGKDGCFLGKLNVSYKNGSSRGGQSADLKSSIEGGYASANQVKESTESHPTKLVTFMGGGKSGESGSGNHKQVRKVKLKVGGVTRTIHTGTTSDGISTGASLSTRSPHCSDAPLSKQSMILKEFSDDEVPSLKGSGGLQGVPWKDFSGRGFCLRKSDSSSKNMPRDGLFNKTDQSEPVRKSKRGPRRPVIDDAFDDGDDDEEIQYLKRHMVYRPPVDLNAKYKDNGEVSRNHQKKLKDSKSKVNGEFVEDLDCRSLTSDGQHDYGKGEQKECVDLSEDDKRERYLTTRQRAFLSGRDGSVVPATTSIEFPNGLPPPPRKQKKKLSEVEQQLKKVETAQRRKLQVEKAAREAQAEAIRKILGQDSSRKKQENKMKKRRDEIAQEKAANASTLPPNTIRWVSNLNGNFVTFSNDIGLPNLFDSKPHGYPLPREKCSGPSCTNTYKYRDSKTKLPLCSLQCYKAINEQQPASTC